MSILEDNKVLARFVGYKIHHISEDERLFLCMKHEPRLAFLYQPHKDWNQLMEAKDLMESDGDTIVTIGHKECTITSCGDIMTGQKPIHKDADTTKAAVYQAVLEYIKKEK